MKTFQDIAAEHLDCIASVETWAQGTQPEHRGGYVLTIECIVDIMKTSSKMNIGSGAAFAEVKKAIAAHKRFVVKMDNGALVKKVRWLDGYGVEYSFTPEKDYVMGIKKAVDVKNLVNGWPLHGPVRIVAI